ncbi:MAG: hypothetical protein IKN75_04670 [Prevotella sp.]|nr:hypothetical protein [Prevotella sp.]
MKKKTYISPEVVTVELQNRPLMQTVSRFNQEVKTETTEDAGTGLGKGGWSWSDDEPEEVDY